MSWTKVQKKVRRGPLFIVINDDWPTDSRTAYASAIAPFHAFLVQMFPQRQPWEVDEFVPVTL